MATKKTVKTGKIKPVLKAGPKGLQMVFVIKK